MQRTRLLEHLDQLLGPDQFHDYCPNGLQVEGRAEIGRLICGVTASLALIEAAASAGADAILVHHGWFWKGEDPCILGMKQRRLQRLLAADINLIAYHLPLDAHPELGNNAQLARIMEWTPAGVLDGRAGRPGLLWHGSPAQPQPAQALADALARRLGRPPLWVDGGSDAPIRRLAWCTGGAQSYIEQAVAAGVDAFVSGEISEQTTHVARECGIHYYAAGHHASERYGVQALGAHLAAEFGLTADFIDIDNPA